jgi:nucleolar complex protein 2
VNHARSYPFHVQLLRSLVHITRHTDSYIPLMPHLLPPLTSILTSSQKPKASTLRPFDFETTLRAPQQYVGTRVYAEGITEEFSFVLAEWLSTRVVHGSVAFPEIVVPLIVTLRKAYKGAKTGKGSGKEAATVRSLIERVEESARWVEARRREATFAPTQTSEVEQWEVRLREKIEDSPIGKYVRTQRKAREKRKKLVEKVRTLVYPKPDFLRV